MRIQVKERLEEVEIRVIDSGPGISELLRDRIMQPFFTTKAIGKGTGLGLSISKGLVEAHAGSLTLDVSSPYTCFVILLPKKQARPIQGESTGGVAV